MVDPFKNQQSPPPPIGFATQPYPNQAPPPYNTAAPYPAAAPYPGAVPFQGAAGPFPGASAPFPDAPGVPPTRPPFPPASSDMYGSNDDGAPLNNAETGAFGFSEKTIRMAFIRKVYGILTVQLCVTIAIICLFFFTKGLKDYVHSNPWVLYVALAVTFVCIIALGCCPGVRRSYPMNFIFLGIFTLCEGFLLGVVASRYDTITVLIAAGICAVVVLSLTIFAFQTKIDFTMCGGFLFVALIVLVCFGFVMIFWRNNVAYLIYSCIGALIFSLYIVFDTQIMLGGKHKYAISPEEHIFAALNLYLDIVQLFMFLLSIVGSARD